MEYTLLSVAMVLLVAAMNYCCYRIGREKGVNIGIKQLVKVQSRIAPDLAAQMEAKMQQHAQKCLSRIFKAFDDTDEEG